MLQKGPDAGSTSPRTLRQRLMGRRSVTPFRAGLVLGSIVTIAVVLLIVQNGESTQLDWLAFEFKAPLWIMLILTMVAGAIVWDVAKVAYRRGRENQRRRERAGDP
jgi:uncharacterized integral membrane protein